jgi:hypothetical protein
VSKKVLSAIAAVALAAAAMAIIGDSGPAQADTVSVPLTCQTSGIPIIGSQTSNATQGITVTAPTQITQNTSDTWQYQSAVTSQSSDLGSGATLNYIHQLQVKLPLPANATRIAGPTLTPGFGYQTSSGQPSVSVVGSNIILSVPGPINSNTSFQLPKVSVTFQATGANLSSIQTFFGGTSYSDPGLSFLANATLPAPISSTENLPTACFPTSSPPLSSTLIIPLDNIAPAITINAPADDGTYFEGANVIASYSCDDGPFGSGVTQCSGPVANGQPIDTSLGTHTFTVNAKDANNNTTSKSHTYTVSTDPFVSVAGGWGTEGGGNTVPFTFSLAREPDQTTTVSYTTQNGTAIAGTDYTAKSGTLTFQPNQPSVQTVNVSLLNPDSIHKGTKRFTVAITGVSHAIVGTSTATGRIREDDVPAVRAIAGSVTRGPGATVPVEVSLQGRPNSNVTINYATSNGAASNHATAGTDYTATSGSLTFTPGGSLVQTVNVPVASAAAWKADALTFQFTATNPGTGQSSVSQGTILDANAHPPALSIGDVSAVERNAASVPMQFPVSLDRAATVPVTVRYSTVAGTATATSDFTPATNKQLVFQPGQTSKVIKVTMFGDTVDESNEAFQVVLSSPFAATISRAAATGTIIDDDPTGSPVAMSITDAKIIEGDATSAFNDLILQVSLSDKSASLVSTRVATVAGTATPGDDYVPFSNKLVKFAAGAVTRTVKVQVLNDVLNEGDETFIVRLSSIVGATVANTDATVTIVDNDNPLPTAPTGLTATTSTSKVGGVDLSWTGSTFPAADFPLTGYEYRVSTNGGSSYGAWTPTGGTSTAFTHLCGEGVSCTYQLRAKNLKGTTQAAGQASTSGLQDATAPSSAVVTPSPNGNADKINGVVLSGDAGFDAGDSGSVAVAVYPCNGCTNVAPTYSASLTPSGGTWTTNPSLAPGVYTLQTSQSDWDGQTTTSDPVVFEVRDAIFVSPFGSDANAGTVAAPKLTLANALSTANAQGRPQVAVSAGTFATSGGVAISTNVSVLGAFDQYTGWTRPGTAGQSGTPNKSLTAIEGVPQGVIVSGAVTVTLDGLSVDGRNTGLGAGASVYGVRAVGASGASLANVTLNNVKVSSAPGKDGTDSTATGTTATTNGCNGGSGATYTTGSTGSCGGSGLATSGFGGGGGDGTLFGGGNGHTGGAGGGGATGGSGGSGSFASSTQGGGGSGGGAGSAAASGSSGANDTGLAGATWAGRNGGAGGNGTSGGGGAGGGGGGGTGASQDGGSGGAGGGGGLSGSGGGGGLAGGGSFAVYSFNANVTVQSSQLTANAGGRGGDGASGGSGSNGGTGGNAREQFLAGNGGAGGGGAGGGGGGGGGGAAGGPSVALFHQGGGAASATSSTLARSLSPSLPGTGGNGGGGGSSGNGGGDGDNPADCLTLCGSVTSGGGGGAGRNGLTGSPGGSGAICVKFDGPSTCTP